RDALKLLTSLRTRTVNQVTKMRGPMILGNQRWEVWTYGKTMQARMPSLSKRSRLAAPDGDSNVKMDRSYWNKTNERAEEPVERMDRLRSYKYGKDWIPFPDAAEDGRLVALSPCLRSH